MNFNQNFTFALEFVIVENYMLWLKFLEVVPVVPVVPVIPVVSNNEYLMNIY